MNVIVIRNMKTILENDGMAQNDLAESANVNKILSPWRPT